MQWVIFVVFALMLAVFIHSPSMVCARSYGYVGVVLSMILMTLFSLAQNNLPIQAIIVGVLLGGLFSGATLAAAWYFHSNEMRSHYANGEYAQQDDSAQ
jgi:hypothetical protein